MLILFANFLTQLTRVQQYTSKWRDRRMQKILLRSSTAVVLLVLLNSTAWAKCGEWYECEPLAIEFSQNEVETHIDDLIDDNFGRCAKIAGPTERLECFDDAIANFGYIVTKEGEIK